MQGFAQEAPALHAAACFLEVDPHALVIRLLQRKAFRLLHVLLEVGKDRVPIGREVLADDRDTDLPLVDRVFQRLDDAVDLLALLEQLRRLDDDLCRQIRAVIQEEVFLQRGVARCFDGQLMLEQQR